MKLYDIIIADTYENAILEAEKHLSMPNRYLILHSWGDGVDPVYLLKTTKTGFSLKPLDTRFDKEWHSTSVERLINDYTDYFDLSEDTYMEIASTVTAAGLMQYLISKDTYRSTRDELLPRMHKDDAIDMIMRCSRILGMDMSISTDHASGVVSGHSNDNKIYIGDRGYYKSDIENHVKSISIEGQKDA